MKNSLGILGSGQLGMLLAEAAQELGIRVSCFDSVDEPPAKKVAYTRVDFHVPAVFMEHSRLFEAWTFEFENIPVAILSRFEEKGTLRPKQSCLSVSKDRLYEKSFFRKLAVPTNLSANVSSEQDVQTLEFDFPAILKTRSLGYDGKGQVRVESLRDLRRAWESLDKKPCLLEQFVDFDKEVSVIAARSESGDIVFYPITENVHNSGILKKSLAPARIRESLEKELTSYVRLILEELKYVGVLAVEFFVNDTCVYANEMAPRVHNSGHWTQHGASVSQFSNHVRAVCGHPIAPAEPLSPTVMLNIVGDHWPAKDQDELSSKLIGKATVHHVDYGKTPHAGRKLGHVNVVFSRLEDACEFFDAR